MEYPRALTSEEEHFLGALVARSLPDGEAARAQTRSVRVTGHCGAGPVSILLLEVDPARCRPCVARDGVIAETRSMTATGEPVELYLYVDGQGFLSELQVLAVTDES